MEEELHIKTNAYNSNQLHKTKSNQYNPTDTNHNLRLNMKYFHLEYTISNVNTTLGRQCANIVYELF